MMDSRLKDQLLGALKIATGYVNSGDNYTDAVVKAASDTDLNQAQTRRFCETFNTARTIYHFESSPEKTANFPLVDQDAVVSNLFDIKPQDEAEKVAMPSIPDYSEYEGREMDAQFGKVATELAPLWATKVANETPNLEDQSMRMYQAVRTHEKMAAHAFAEANIARESVRALTIKLADELTASHWVSGNEKYARLRGSFPSTYGYNRLDPVFAAVEVHMPEYMKCAEGQLEALPRVIDASDLTDELASIHEIKEALEGAAALEALGKTVEKEGQDAKASFEAIFQSPAPTYDDFDSMLTEQAKEAQTVTKHEVPDYTLKQMFTGAEPGKRTVTNTNNGIMQEAQKGLEAGKAVGVGLDTLLGAGDAKANKDITSRLKNQQREVLLQDLMVNDPFIADGDQEQIAAIYSQISQIAPEVSLNKEVVRAVIRQGLHSATAVSPFDASSWADLEKTLAEVQGTLPERARTAGAHR